MATVEEGDTMLILQNKRERDKAILRRIRGELEARSCPNCIQLERNRFYSYMSRGFT